MHHPSICSRIQSRISTPNHIPNATKITKPRQPSNQRSIRSPLRQPPHTGVENPCGQPTGHQHTNRLPEPIHYITFSPSYGQNRQLSSANRLHLTHFLTTSRIFLFSEELLCSSQLSISLVTLRNFLSTPALNASAASSTTSPPLFTPRPVRFAPGILNGRSVSPFAGLTTAIPITPYPPPPSPGTVDLRYLRDATHTPSNAVANRSPTRRLKSSSTPTTPSPRLPPLPRRLASTASSAASHPSRRPSFQALSTTTRTSRSSHTRSSSGTLSVTIHPRSTPYRSQSVPIHFLFLRPKARGNQPVRLGGPLRGPIPNSVPVWLSPRANRYSEPVRNRSARVPMSNLYLNADHFPGSLLCQSASSTPRFAFPARPRPPLVTFEKSITRPVPGQ